MGSDVTVLAAPQCRILEGIEALGLPQSTDQADDPLVVGSAAQARIFTETVGRPLDLRVEGADYPAFIYFDYYDADGTVFHLIPNAHVPLRRLPAGAPLRIAKADPLFAEFPYPLDIAPPVGRDIAVALAVSEPLYEGVRPLAEPAADYLAWLAPRLAERRAKPGFKGEWVYFFIDTVPARP